MSERQTVAGAYDKIKAHEDQCALQYRGIRSDIAEIKSLIHWMLGGTATIAFGLIAWMAVQLYSLNNARLDALERPSAVPVVQHGKARPV